ncbi:hypothetical protein PRZ48_007470 [Zasmidium cellare]|uniref:Uncharacterized protein n=1 Tax=Zasmidium cellare TaxID=395010 RepID=A0ABR0EJF7_ZASCE|nr:hypothetical protein PRZ48_007470 [Zasmidium cellare]
MYVTAMKTLSLVLLVSGSLAHPRKKLTTHYDDNDPISQTSRVTASVNTDDGLKVQCWEIGGASPVRATTLAGNIEITLFSFSPSVTLFSFDKDDVTSSAVDFRAKPNLFTVKDGLVLIDADVELLNAGSSSQTYVFADVNGDDWFYFEDTTSGRSVKSATESTFNARTISGSDTTLINFRYERTPGHKVLHEGRCNFAGLRPVEEGKGDVDAREGGWRFKEQL